MYNITLVNIYNPNILPSLSWWMYCIWFILQNKLWGTRGLKKIVRENVKLRNKFCDKKNFIKSFFFSISPAFDWLLFNIKWVVYWLYSWWNKFTNYMSCRSKCDAGVSLQLDINVQKQVHFLYCLNIKIYNIYSISVSVKPLGPSWSGEVYSIQHDVIKFVSDLRQVGRFPPPITLTVTI